MDKCEVQTTQNNFGKKYEKTLVNVIFKWYHRKVAKKFLNADEITLRCKQMCAQEVEARDINNSTDVRNDIVLLEQSNKTIIYKLTAKQ